MSATTIILRSLRLLATHVLMETAYQGTLFAYSKLSICVVCSSLSTQDLSFLRSGSGHILCQPLSRYDDRHRVEDFDRANSCSFRRQPAYHSPIFTSRSKASMASCSGCPWGLPVFTIATFSDDTALSTRSSNAYSGDLATDRCRCMIRRNKLDLTS